MTRPSSVPNKKAYQTNTASHGHLIDSLAQAKHQILRSFSMTQLYSTHCSHHGSVYPLLKKIHISYGHNASLPHTIANLEKRINSPIKIQRKSPTLQQLTTHTNRSPPSSCSGSHSSLTSSTSTHPATKTCKFFTVST